MRLRANGGDLVQFRKVQNKQKKIVNLSRLKIKYAALTCTTIMRPALKSLLGMSCHLENQPPERRSSRTGAAEAKQSRGNDRL